METYVPIGIVLFALLVEIVPVKFSPLGWLGSKLNRNLNDKINGLNVQISNLENKVDEIDIDTIRNRILMGESQLRKGVVYTRYQWDNLYKDISKWNNYHKTHEELNGFLKVSIENIDEYYKKSEFKD